MRATRHGSKTGKRLATLAALWGVIGLGVAGFGAAAFMTANRPADAYALCQSSGLKAAATTMIMVDATDTFTQDQRRRLQSSVEFERERLPDGGRLIIVALNPDAPFEPTELVSVCNPGKGENANPLLVTRSKVEKRWHTLFADPIDKAVQQSLDLKTSERSPIIVTLAAVLTRADFDTRVKARRLVVISDLLEHEKGMYSQLRGGDFWGAYQASPLPKSARLDLQGVAVAIDYLQRGKFTSIQGPRHQAFWQRLLSEAGASEVSFLGVAAAPIAPVVANTQTNTAKGQR
jgi:hypothetical protein